MSVQGSSNSVATKIWDTFVPPFASQVVTVIAVAQAFADHTMSPLARGQVALRALLFPTAEHEHPPPLLFAPSPPKKNEAETLAKHSKKILPSASSFSSAMGMGLWAFSWLVQGGRCSVLGHCLLPKQPFTAGRRRLAG